MKRRTWMVAGATLALATALQRAVDLADAGGYGR